MNARIAQLATHSQFFDDLKWMLVVEVSYLENDRDRYLEYMVKPLCDRVKDWNFDGTTVEAERRANDCESPIRNGMILLGLYMRVISEGRIT